MNLASDQADLEQETCQERVYSGSRDFSGHPCGRPVKADRLCGRHLAAKRRRTEKDEQWRRDYAASSELLASLKKRLSELGINGHPELDRKGSATGRVVLRMDDLERLLTEQRGGDGS